MRTIVNRMFELLAIYDRLDAKVKRNEIINFVEFQGLRQSPKQGS